MGSNSDEALNDPSDGGEDDLVPDTTDDENAVAEVPPPLWHEFEQQVAALMANLGNGHAEHNIKMTGVVSKTQRQVDVLVSGEFAGREIRVAVECKRYKRRLGIGKIDEFVGKLLDLRVDAGVLYCVTGYTKQAEVRASEAVHPQISLFTLAEGVNDWTEALEHLAGVEECSNENCYGSFVWEDFKQDTGEVVQAGQCFSCGTWTVRCPTCEWETMFFFDEIECDGCERVFALVSSRPGEGDVTVVAVSPPPDDPDAN